MTLAIGEEYGNVVRGRNDRYKDWVELCMMAPSVASLLLRHAPGAWRRVRP